MAPPCSADQLADLGIATTPSEVFTPFDLVGEEVKRRLGPVPVLVIGTDDVGRVMESSGHTQLAGRSLARGQSGRRRGRP